MQLRGKWDDAAQDAQAACELLASRPAAGAAFYRVGEIHRLRGEFAKAEAAYTRANERGRKPQPGLSLLRLAQGQIDAAAASIRGVLLDTRVRAARARMLAAAVEILLAAGDLENARAAAAELAEIASAIGAPLLSRRVRARDWRSPPGRRGDCGCGDVAARGVGNLAGSGDAVRRSADLPADGGCLRTARRSGRPPPRARCARESCSTQLNAEPCLARIAEQSSAPRVGRPARSANGRRRSFACSPPARRIATSRRRCSSARRPSPATSATSSTSLASRAGPAPRRGPTSTTSSERRTQDYPISRRPRFWVIRPMFSPSALDRCLSNAEDSRCTTRSSSARDVPARQRPCSWLAGVSRSCSSTGQPSPAIRSRPTSCGPTAPRSWRGGDFSTDWPRRVCRPSAGG